VFFAFHAHAGRMPAFLMNISYNWLKDVISIDLPAEELAEKLTRVGLAVEGIHSHGDDFVFDIDLTSNRPDCLSHLGVAREIRVITGVELNAEVVIADQGLSKAPFPAILAPEIVKIEEPDLCHRFTARIIKNVKIGPSPEWLVTRINAIGERSISNVADITNYVMHELGQPMHAFDLDKLAGNRIVVRRAKHGEIIRTLDDVERKLDESMLVIADAEKPAAIGGVMGGLGSSITESTVNVLLEVAYFKRESIRQTSRKLGLATEASYRFERGVDIENLLLASDRATDLICQFSGGKAGEFVDVYPTRSSPNKIESKDVSYAVKRLTGLDVDTARCVRILNALGIMNQSDSEISEIESHTEEIQIDPKSADYSKSKTFVSPSWRHDLAIEEDLVEEVARHAGYENIANELPPALAAGGYQPNEMRKMRLRQTLTNAGFDEAISYSFIDTGFDEIFQPVPDIVDATAKESFITLRDSVIEGAIRMRPSLLPGLLDAVKTNFNHQRRNVAMFEIGTAFAALSGESGLPNERELFALVLTGSEVFEDRAMHGPELDFYDAKGALESALNAADVSGIEFSADDVAHLRKGQTAAISVNGKHVGYIGRLNDEITVSYKFKQSVYLAEVDLQTMLAVKPSPTVYRPLAKYPSIIRDVSFIAKRYLTFDDIRAAVIELDADLCQGVEFVDVYEGKGMEEDERSITIRLEYRSDERTLVEEEIASVHQIIIHSLESGLSIRHRY